MRNVSRRGAVAIVAVGLLLATLIGCTRIDEVTATPAVIPSANPTPPVHTAISSPALSTPRPTPLPECEVGLRLVPGEGCTYRNNSSSSFELEILENGNAAIDGTVSGRRFASRIVGPQEELCICDLKTENDGTGRIIVALPQWPPVDRSERPPPLREPFEGDCRNGLVVLHGEICRFPETYCFFDVTADGLGRFATVSDRERIDVKDIDLGEKTISFAAAFSEGRWTIEHLSRVIVERGGDDRSECIADPLVVELTEAARRGDAATIRRLISEGVDVNGRAVSGNSALWYAAASREDIDITQTLLEAGADPGLRDWNGNPVLSDVIWNENLTMLKLLVESGANVNGTDRYGSPPLDPAVSRGNIEILQYLVDSGADVNQQTWGGSLLSRARKSVEITRFLIDNGADVNALNSHGNAVLVRAVHGDNVETLKLILDAGANPDAESELGNPALKIAVESGSIEKARALLEAGANPDGCGADGRSPLSRAIESRNLEMVTLLVKAGADVNDFVTGGQTMLEHAGRISSPEIVQYLIDAGAE